MATVRVPILTFSLRPDASGNTFLEPFSVKAVNDVWQQLVAIFNDTATRIGFFASFEVPPDYAGNPSIVWRWTANAIAGDVEWDFDYRAVADGESLDQAGVQESVNVASAAPAAAFQRVTASAALTAGNLAPADTVEFRVFRDGTDAGDTMAAAAILFELIFQYDNA